MLLDMENQTGLRQERSLFRPWITTMHILLGLFFILSGIANYL